MSLEEVFVAIVDQVSQQNTRYERSSPRRNAPSRNRAEQEIAKDLADQQSVRKKNAPKGSAPSRARAEEEVATRIAEKNKKSKDGGYSALFGDDDE